VVFQSEAFPQQAESLAAGVRPFLTNPVFNEKNRRHPRATTIRFRTELTD